MDENYKKLINISVGLVIIIFVIRSFFSWIDLKEMWDTGQSLTLSYTLFGYIGESFGIMASLMAVFNKWAWKWKWIRWMHNMPILTEKYNGTCSSDYDRKIYTGEIYIKQTFTNIAIKFKTDESISRSLTTSFCMIHNNQYLIYTYQNDPLADIQDRSPIHYGTAILDVSNPSILEGNYFTGRKTRGSMKFKSVS